MQSFKMKAFFFTAMLQAVASISIPAQAFADTPQKGKLNILLGLIAHNGVVVPIAEYRGGRWHGNPEFSGNGATPLATDVWTGHFAKLAEWKPVHTNASPFRTSLKAVEVGCSCNNIRGLLIDNRSRPDPERETAHCASKVALAYMSAGEGKDSITADAAEQDVSEDDGNELLHDATKRFSSAAESYARSPEGAGAAKILKDFDSYPLQFAQSWFISSSDAAFPSLTYYSFSKIYFPKKENAWAERRLAGMSGWFRETQHLNTKFALSDTDGLGYVSVEPLGAIRTGEDEYVIAIVRGYESYGATIFKVEKTGLKPVLELGLGGC